MSTEELLLFIRQILKKCPDMNQADRQLGELEKILEEQGLPKEQRELIATVRQGINDGFHIMKEFARRGEGTFSETGIQENARKASRWKEDENRYGRC